MTELIIQTGKHQGKRIDLAGKDCIIGRHESCKIRVASGDVSKQHCRLKHKEGVVHAKDLGSRNGTFVNDRALDKEVRLKPGDLLRVGPMTFLVSEEKSAPDAPGPGSDASNKTGESGDASTDDDLIAAWLSEGGDIEKSGQDTTVMVPSSEQNPPEAPSSNEANPNEAKTSRSSGDPTRNTVRNRAKDIIRRWRNEQGKG